MSRSELASSQPLYASHSNKRKLTLHPPCHPNIAFPIDVHRHDRRPNVLNSSHHHTQSFSLYRHTPLPVPYFRLLSPSPSYAPLYPLDLRRSRAILSPRSHLLRPSSQLNMHRLRLYDLDAVAVQPPDERAKEDGHQEQ
ncbi:hypothetical protein PMIN06_002318 [Paraphaeosphaeria minitans]